MKTITPPKYVTFYMWDSFQANTICIWYPDGSSEYLDSNGEWEPGGNWFAFGADPADIKICEIIE